MDEMELICDNYILSQDKSSMEKHFQKLEDKEKLIYYF